MQKIKNSFLFKWTFLLLFITSIASAQEIEWQKTIGGSINDELYSVQQTTDGGFILGGYSNSNISGDKTENNRGGYDYWIVKVNKSGIIQWQKTIGGSSDDILYSLNQSTDGGYILGGASGSGISGEKSESSIGGKDYWIVKIDSIGNIQWQKTIGGNSTDQLRSIDQTTDGGYILGGLSQSNISGHKTENAIGSVDYWIVKTDSLGNIQWDNTIGGSNPDYLFDLKHTNDGGCIFGGRSGSNISGDKTENCIGNTGNEDYWIVKADANGNIQWENTIGGGYTDGMHSVDQTADGGYILGGSSFSYIFGDKSETCLGNTDCWIVKIDSLGSVQWDKTIGGNVYDKLFSIKQTADRGYILGGTSESVLFGDKTEYSLGFYDFWIVKTDSLGSIQWQNTIGGSGDEWVMSIQQTNDGGYVIGGYSTSNSSGDKTENCFGSRDFWIVKLTDKYNYISGKLFSDLNNNGIQDSGEFPLSGRKITDQNTGRFAFSDLNGDYSIVVIDSGNFTVMPQSVIWYTPFPSSQIAVFTSIHQTDSINDFAFQPQGSFEDVCIKITPLGNFRSGFTASYEISYGNYGSTTVAPTIYFYPYSNVTYQSATLTPNNITPDSIVWNLPAMTPFQTGSIIVTVTVDLGLPIGTLINSSAHIEPFLTDDNPSCNNSNWEVYITGSVDPNDILVSEDTLITTQLSNAPWLDYIIRFQNTGNDTAFTVKILNPIDTFKLNISSIEFVNASHPVNLNWINYQRNMEFKFENILLVDSNTNEPLSHGFVRYRIQPKTNLSAGDSITNFAAIYFDFNEPVITNTAKTIIVLPTGLASANPARGKLHVFPNPTENILNISGIHLENGKAQLRLTDIYGKLIFEKTITSITTTLETNDLSSGIYLIQSGELRATFVKQ